jgi:hypothetical protein
LAPGPQHAPEIFQRIGAPEVADVFAGLDARTETQQTVSGSSLPLTAIFVDVAQ